MNHVRFHSWCPPEAAFEAADEVGIYLQAELPMWIKDVGNIRPDAISLKRNSMPYWKNMATIPPSS